jgi:hypothetical protein
MRRTLTVIALFVAAASAAPAAAVTVNCDRGQSLNKTLAKLATLNSVVPIQVTVTGTCTEYVQVRGFEGLTLKGVPGMTLVQPSTPLSAGMVGVLTIEASRGVTVDGFTVRGLTSSEPGIFVRSGSADVRLRNTTVEGGLAGVLVTEGSQVSLARVTARDPLGWTTLGVFDLSSVFVEDSLFEHTTGEMWHHGIHVGKAMVTIHGTTIRNMQAGMVADMNGIIDVSDFNLYSPAGGPTDVVIESPAGTNFNGLIAGSGASVNVAGVKLRITNAGQWWGGDSGGVLVRDGGSLNVSPSSAGVYLEVAGSQGQGVFVTGNSHASLAGSSITGSGHNGLVVVNNSSAAVAAGPDGSPSEISGSATHPGSGAKDVFCDSRSLITGGANIANATAQCDNLLPGPDEGVPW